MLNKIVIRNFKLFDEIEIELGERVVFVGPNNSGKTSALQGLALWNTGVRRWLERRGSGNVPKERSGVTINRRDLIAMPVPSANLLWRDLHVREGYKDDGRNKTRNVLVEIAVEGVDKGQLWSASLEFDYANEESFYCRSRLTDGVRAEVPAAAGEVRLAYLPPMSGLLANETRLDAGAIDVRIGEGRTAEVLRNLCWQVLQRGNGHWQRIVSRMDALFGVKLHEPLYVKERGEIVMSFETRGRVTLDLAAAGRGQQQTLLLLAHMEANPGAVLLLDEPDAHLEILRQRQIYQLLMDTAAETGSQVIAASHSEVILDEAADRDTVIAFVGKPHRIDDRGSQVLKSLKEVGFDQYMQAEEVGVVLYFEGSTDLAILRAFAKRLNHQSQNALERPFVAYVGNQPRKAQDHFYALREAKSDLVGLALYDRLDQNLPADPNLRQLMWSRREIENYLNQRETLLAYAASQARNSIGDIFAQTWASEMDVALVEVTEALATLGKDAWSPDLKASEEFLVPLFRSFYKRLGLPNAMAKTDFHMLAPFVDPAELEGEVKQKLDQIAEVVSTGRPRRA